MAAGETVTTRQGYIRCRVTDETRHLACFRRRSGAEEVLLSLSERMFRSGLGGPHTFGRLSNETSFLPPSFTSSRRSLTRRLAVTYLPLR